MGTNRERTSTILLLFSLTLAVLPISNASAKDPIKGFIDSFGYGYEVKVAVNGNPVAAIKGKGQQATRLFSVDHPMKKDLPKEQQNLFVLKEGENSIVVEFRKVEDGQTPLRITLEVPDRYTQPLFQLTSSTRKSGKVERKFRIDARMPAAFRTVMVTDRDM